MRKRGKRVHKNLTSSSYYIKINVNLTSIPKRAILSLTLAELLSLSPCFFLSREFYIYFYNELCNANVLFLLDNQFSYKLKLLGKLVVYHDIVALFGVNEKKNSNGS